MPALDVQFANSSVIMVGGNPINSFSDGSLEANVTSVLYEDTLTDLLTSHPWRFCTDKFGPLSKDVASPKNEFEYSYTLPAGQLKLWAVQPTYIEYEIFKDKKLYTDWDEEIYVESTIRPDESQFPPYFRRLFQLTLASVIAEPITENTSKAERYEKMAEKYKKDAKRLDSTQRRQVLSSRGNPLINVRG